MIEQLLNYDAEFFLFLNNLGNKNWDGFWMAYTTKWNWIPFYAILLYLLFKQSDLKSFILTVVIVVAMMFFTDQITNVFKDSFQRLRPCHVEGIFENMRMVKPSCGGRFGYFSGHSSNSMAVAIFVGAMLRHRFKYLIYILIVWAMLMAYSRVYVGVHYPLDIVSGMLFGVICGILFYKLNKYLNTKLLPVFSK